VQTSTIAGTNRVGLAESAGVASLGLSHEVPSQVMAAARPTHRPSPASQIVVASSFWPMPGRCATTLKARPQKEKVL
jgi:hypothetical protein